MIEIKDKVNCCGCSACRGICPKHCIEMKTDEEGFLYPQVNKDLCINCHLCERVCPILNSKAETNHPIQGYLLQNKDKEVLKRSSSGGAFYSIAEFILKNGGIVYGASFDDTYQKVIHISVEAVEDLPKLQRSKYVQSEISASLLLDLKKQVLSNRWVLFSGTPCQVEGVLNYVGKDYPKFVTVDIACHSVPSPMIFEKYRDYLSQNGAIESIGFRNKKYGYSYVTNEIWYKNGKRCYFGSEYDPYLRFFLGGVSSRPSCYQCKFKKMYRRSDFTLWDSFDVLYYKTKFNNNRGVSKMMVHTKRGQEIFNRIKESYQLIEMPLQELLRHSPEITTSLKMNPKRSAFFEDAKTMGGKELFAKYAPIGVKQRIKRRTLVILSETHLLRPVKDVAIKLTKHYGE